jgi:hypothetical protein
VGEFLAFVESLQQSRAELEHILSGEAVTGDEIGKSTRTRSLRVPSLSNAQTAEISE